MESCFGTLKTEIVHRACAKTRDIARHDLFASIDGYDNRQRFHSALLYITPERAERQAAQSNVHQIGGRDKHPSGQDHDKHQRQPEPIRGLSNRSQS